MLAYCFNNLGLKLFILIVASSGLHEQLCVYNSFCAMYYQKMCFYILYILK